MAPKHKFAAREAVVRWLQETGHEPLVRVNAGDSPYQADDLAALGSLRVAGVIVPKVNTPRDLHALRVGWPAATLFPLIETAQGLEHATEIASVPGVGQLLLGALDLHADCGIDYPHPALLEHARLGLVLASRCAGIVAPIDTPHPAVREFEEVAKYARAFARPGFAGKLCIHPGQIASVADAFRPSEEQLQWARADGRCARGRLGECPAGAHCGIARARRPMARRLRPGDTALRGVPQMRR
ncbi:HpcH/HpaI aldolase/citrate lyase family protein [Variovorax sp. RA8]|uniref:HpcH/HpaI aldolase/citrate lyase family protein n=1 Tax=Variovorax sp. (strain JCM 16519 / RA8) TaxID=662548 RepID=UPI001316B617|nr:aldolase/citrate lyase family protein [Variovorax sp. RA8]VTU34325.1 (3S)-malyl-CoA thioesterase [Variovorax sp. RA8]